MNGEGVKREKGKREREIAIFLTEGRGRMTAGPEWCQRVKPQTPNRNHPTTFFDPRLIQQERFVL
jgi:hypothetical protein